MIVRNEADFAERKTFVFTYTKVFSIVAIVFSTIFLSSVFIGKELLTEWYDPDIKYRELEREVARNSEIIDSLEVDIAQKHQYIISFRRILDPEYKEEVLPDFEAAPVIANNEEMENASDESVPDNIRSLVAANLYLSPLKGCAVLDSFSLADKNYSVKISSEIDPGVRSIDDGVVVLVNWDKDQGYVIGIEHDNQLISLYKGNDIILKKVGTFVQSGEVISLAKTSDHGATVLFEVWLAGEAIDPLELITCNY